MASHHSPAPPCRAAPHCAAQKGDGAAAVSAKRKELDAKRAAAAARTAEKTFYRVTVRVRGLWNLLQGE